MNAAGQQATVSVVQAGENPSLRELRRRFVYEYQTGGETMASFKEAVVGGEELGSYASVWGWVSIDAQPLATVGAAIRARAKHHMVGDMAVIGSTHARVDTTRLSSIMGRMQKPYSMEETLKLSTLAFYPLGELT